MEYCALGVAESLPIFFFARSRWFGRANYLLICTWQAFPQRPNTPLLLSPVQNNVGSGSEIML